MSGTRDRSNAAPSTAIAEPSVWTMSMGVIECGAGSARYHHDQVCSGSHSRASRVTGAALDGPMPCRCRSPPSGYSSTADTIRAVSARQRPPPSNHVASLREDRSNLPMARPAHR